MDKMKFWLLALGFIIFLWFLGPDNSENERAAYYQATGTVPELAQPVYADTAMQNLIDSGIIRTPGAAASGDVADQTPAQFGKEKIRIRTARGLLPLMVGMADTEELSRKGLMFYRTWPAGVHGVFFPFAKETKLSMWMKNTYLPLDMLFMNARGRIVHIARNTAPLSEALITTPYPANAVIEIPAGSAKLWNISTGDTVMHSFFVH